MVTSDNYSLLEAADKRTLPHHADISPFREQLLGRTMPYNHII